MDFAGRWSVDLGGSRLGSSWVLTCEARKQRSIILMETTQFIGSSVAAAVAAMSGLSESGADNADAIEQGGVEAHRNGDQDAVIQDRTASGDAGSAQSTRKVDPQAPGWTKRVRVGNQLLNKQPAMDSVIADQVECGDAMSAHSTGRMDPQAPGWTRRGKPVKENSRSCRCEFPVMIRLLRTHDNGWYITQHRMKHNHSLSTTCGEKVNWPSHKHIDVYMKDLIKQSRQNNINVTKLLSSGVLTSGFAWSTDSSVFYMWEGSVDGEVNRGLVGENFVAKPDLQADQEVIVLGQDDSA